MKPKVSVSIITYNHRDFIAQTIESALDQKTDFDFKIHIGDDFSDDGTREIIERYKARHPERIVLNLQSQRPDGIAGRVNNLTNLASCDGEYIAMLDGDDYWKDPDKLQCQVDFLESNRDYSAHSHAMDVQILPENEILPERRMTNAGLAGLHEPIAIPHDEVLDTRLVQTSTICFRREALQIPPWFAHVYAADLAIFLLVSQSGPILFEPVARSVYRIHPDSAMGGISDTQFLRRIVSDWKIFFDHLPATRTPKQRKTYLSLKLQLAVRDRRYLAAARTGADILRQFPIASARSLAKRIGA